MFTAIVHTLKLAYNSEVQPEDQVSGLQTAVPHGSTGWHGPTNPPMCVACGITYSLLQCHGL